MRLLFLLPLLVFSFVGKAQTQLPLGDTTYNIQLRSSVDTVKVRIVAYGEKNQLLWFDGYAIRLFLIEVKTQKMVDRRPSQIRWYSKTWEAIKPQDVIEELSKIQDWK